MAEPAFIVERFVAGDGYPLRYRRYPAWGMVASRPAPLPKGEGRNVRGAVVVIHGIQSHAGWYGHSCQRLSEAGFEVFFLDRRGSGMNERERGDAPGFRCLIDDIAEFIRYRPERGLPVYLVAISWGGKLAVALQRRHPGLVAGMALICPGFFPRVSLTLRQRLKLFRCRLSDPTRLFPVPLDDPALFTASPCWQQFLRDDPMSIHQATARFLLESARLDMYLRICARQVTAPTLLLLAGRDRIIHNGPTRRFVRRFAARDKRIIEYPEAHHTLEFEPNPEVFIGDLTNWLGSMKG
ncbi:MAG: alpha/beta hydrolase [Planctomycetes bacterium]|nr:alpha/beta hydrolase [Planctomycetota bacterium]